MNKENKGLIGKIGTLIMWIVFVLLWVFKDWWFLTVGLMIIHFCEAIFIGIKKGKEHGHRQINSFFLTWAFGFTWWKYL
jgi:hypothetical protein